MPKAMHSGIAAARQALPPNSPVTHRSAIRRISEDFATKGSFVGTGLKNEEKWRRREAENKNAVD